MSFKNTARDFSRADYAAMFAPQDPTLRNQLKADVRTFVANGGKITKAAQGETGYMEGKKYLRRYRPKVNEEQI